jgi:hypothetical protein
MVNTLRITGVLAGILGAVLFIFTIIYGVHDDEKAKEFLESPGIREKFEQSVDNRMSKNKDVTSPLVQQAQAFARYLNPKPTEKRALATSRGPKAASNFKVTPKFKLVCTSYCPSDPNTSLALIDEPGQARRWVRQSGKIGHFLIHQIKDGRIVVQSSGEEDFELAIDESSVKNSPVTSKRTATPARTNSRFTASNRTRPTLSRAPATVLREQKSSEENEDEQNADEQNDRDARAKALIEKLRGLQKSTVSDKTAGVDDKEKAAKIEKLISQYQSTRISSEEAKKLGNLGKTLQEEPDPNRIPSESGESK